MATQKLQVSRAAAVTPSDTNNIPYVGYPSGPTLACVLYVGGAGNVKVETDGGDIVTFTGLNVGQFVPVNVVKVYATDTTATNIVALW
jgi:hypothetical protein